MNEPVSELLQNIANESQGRLQALERLVSAADTAKVFGPPVTSGEYTVITAAEVGSGGGFGSGMGFGTPPARRGKRSEEPETVAAGAADAATSEGAGGGGGGGGGSMGRPVAAIIIGPAGVEVKPLLDVTKVTLAALTGFGAMGLLALKILKKR